MVGAGEEKGWAPCDPGALKAAAPSLPQSGVLRAIGAAPRGRGWFMQKAQGCRAAPDGSVRFLQGPPK